MVQALVNLSENANRVLNVVKAKYELKDKSEAIELLVERYIAAGNDPELRPEFIRKVLTAKAQKPLEVQSIAQRYGPRTLPARRQPSSR